MKLSECKIGTVVCKKDKSDFYEKRFFPCFIGHIVGFDVNEFVSGAEVIVKVSWCNGITTEIHPGNIDIYED